MKNETMVLKTALPLYLEGTNGKAVLVQHGYTGYPEEMYGVARRIHAEGYTVVVPRLPGHGTCSSDFRKSNWKLWYNHVRNEYLNLQSGYDSVSVVGLSMGGGLALLMAAEFRPEKAILLAPALVIRNKLVYLMPLLKYFVSSLKKDWIPSPDDGEDRIYMAGEYWKRHYTAQLSSFVKLMKTAQRRLTDVVCPVYIMLSEKDSTVSPEAGPVIEKRVNGPVKTHILQNSPHVFFEGPENDFVVEKVIEWLKEEKKDEIGESR